MREDDYLTVTVVAEAMLTLDEFARACAVSPQWVLERVHEGMLTELAANTATGEWRFSVRDLRRARHMRAFERDFDAVPELAALVVDLMDELAVLRARIRRAGVDQ